MASLGYSVIGLHFGAQNTCHHYYKQYPEKRTLVVFSEIHKHMVCVYRMDEKNWKDYQDGKISLSHNGKGNGTDPSGHPIVNVQNFMINEPYEEIKSKKTLRVLLEKAEKTALQ